MNPSTQSTTPGSLSVLDAVAMLVGVVIGIGIFGFPPLVAQQAPTPLFYMGLWLAGGLVMLIGALCYAELGSAYPDEGGEYHFLSRAWGPSLAVLFGWARCTVIQTGAIAAVAFIYGDYAQQLLPLGSQGPALHGALAVIVLTGFNVVGTAQSKYLQRILAGVTVIALLAVAAAGLLLAGPDAGADAGAVAGAIADAATAGAGAGASTGAGAAALEPAGLNAGALGMGMVFVLLTYGGWNEAAYLSGELRDARRNMVRVLLIGTVVVTVVYLVTNLAYLQIFGLEGLRQSGAVGAELMRRVAGPWAAVLLSLLICFTALSTINGTIFTGARVYYALGRDLPQLQALGAWNTRGATPVRALLAQATITLALILFGAFTEDGVQTMVAYTAPVFWLFMFLTAIALIALRWRDPQRERPFRVPLYPITPLLFAASCLGLFWSSTLYAGMGAILGLIVLAAGLPLLWMQRRAAVASA